MTARRSLGVSAALALTLVSLTACSRSVQWEEEVPLNTGETIWVKRSGTYTYKGLTSDGSHFSYVPEWRSTIEFTYKGKKYRHTDDVFLNVLAIDPTGVPVLVGIPSSDWEVRNALRCATPSYVQFKPTEDKGRWMWPKAIETWTFNLPTNLLLGLPSIEEDGGRFLSTQRQERNASAMHGFPANARIDPTYRTNGCPKE